ncbi:MAG: hypothetical protein QM831_06955 [Kofleriaceae bacterium]
MAFGSLLRRLGYAKLDDYGLVLTAEGRVLSTRPTVLDDGLGGKIVGWREGDLAAMELSHWEPSPAARPAKPASPLAPTVPQMIHAGAPVAPMVMSPSGRTNAATVPPPVPAKRALPGMTAPMAAQAPIAPTAPAPIANAAPPMTAAVAVAQSLTPIAAPIPAATKRPPTPLPLETSQVPRMESQSDVEPPEDEWEWQIAVARARAAAEWAEEEASKIAATPSRQMMPAAAPSAPPPRMMPAATPSPIAASPSAPIIAQHPVAQPPARPKRESQITGTSTTVALPSAQTAMLAANRAQRDVESSTQSALAAADRAHREVATQSGLTPRAPIVAQPRTKAPTHQTFSARAPLVGKNEPAPLPPAETQPVPRVSAESAYGRPALRPKRATSPGFAQVTNQNTARTATHEIPRVRFPSATPATVPSHMLEEDFVGEDNTSVTAPLVDDDATRPGLLLPSPASTSRRVAAKER